MGVAPGQGRSRPVVLAVFVAAVGFALIAPTRLDIAILLPEVMRAVGVSGLALGGLVATATVLGAGVCEPFAGWFSDRVGRHLSLWLGVAVFSAFTLLTAAASGFAMLLLVRILLGVGQAIFAPAYFAFLGSAFPRRRGFVLGSLGGLFSIGAALNPLGTRAFFAMAGRLWQAPFVVWGLFGLLVAAGIALVGRSGVFDLGRGTAPQARGAAHPAGAGARGGPAGLAGSGSGAEAFFKRDMVLLLGVMAIWGFMQYGFLGLFVTFLRVHQHFTLGAAASVASAEGWCAFGMGFVGGWVSDHLGRRNTMLIWGLVTLAFAYPVFTLSTTFWSAMILAGIFGSFQGNFFALGIAYAQDMARAENMGGRTGATTGVGHIMAGFSGLLVGAIAQAGGFGVVAWTYTAASAALVVCVLLTRDRLHEARLAQRAATAAAGGGR